MDEFVGGGGDGLSWGLGDDAEVSLTAGKVCDVERREVSHLRRCSP